MEDYLKHIEIFHKDYLYSQTNKEKYIKCKHCENNKRFIINENELIYNCGNVGSGPCGDQFKINIPDYIHYEKIMEAFQKTMNGTFNFTSDIYDFSEYDLNILSKHLSIDDDLHEYEEIKKTILDDTQKLTSFFNASNKLKQYYQELSSLNEIYQKNMIKKKKILYDLQNDMTLTIEDKIRLRKDYAKIIKNEINDNYPIYEKYINHQQNHYLLLNPEDKRVHKYQNRYLDTVIPKKKKEKKVKQKEDKTNLKKKLGDELEELELEMAKEISDKKQEDTLETTNTKEIKYFSRSKNNKWLSAFNQAEPFEYDGFTYPTVEHAFHAQKIEPTDPKANEYKEYLSQLDLKPNDAKKYGGKTSFKKNNFIFRKDWDKIKLNLMKEITEAYYSENPKMKQKLIDTKDAELLHKGPLIDNYWGIKSDGNGENNHGKILMELRKEYSS